MSSGSIDDFLVVGLGASAGGVRATKEFYEGVLQPGGIAYDVILHNSPEHESRLAEVLQESTALPVLPVRERVASWWHAWLRTSSSHARASSRNFERHATRSRPNWP